MFATIRNAWKVEEIRKRIVFTLLMIGVFRLGHALPVPFANTDLIRSIYEGAQQSLLSMLNLLSGGGLATLSVFALGVGPYITSSIVVQLLTFAIPRLEELSKEGEEGRKKIQQITKILGLALAVLQAFAMVRGIFARAFAVGGTTERLVAMLVMVAGAQFVVWLGDLITEHGIGNGTSMIIFVGIIANMPGALLGWSQGVVKGAVNPLIALLILLVVLGVVVIVVLLNEGERKIPVQYAKRVVGRKMYGGQATHIPIKVNMGGVMPIIFATSLLALPSTLGLLLGGGVQDFVTKYLTPSGWGGAIVQWVVQIGLIILFAYFYNTIQFNTVEYAKNLQQYGGFIPGIRPGRPTSDYLSRIVNRITLIGAIILAVLSIAPDLVAKIAQVAFHLGGTSVIIVVGVVLETVRQMETMMQMRHYKGFLNR
uniref:preprotein translocase subunit SecY n=1 Tax=Ndongobacter massiliensis TaxID=1871025 RepID=UPI0009317C5A|nr:preprotein translocase subunit SecY [Ndongobacter massiliensis]